MQTAAGKAKSDVSFDVADVESQQLDSDDNKKAEAYGESSWFSRWSFFLCVIPYFKDHILQVDLRHLWRRHQVWAKKDGNELRGLLTARYASTSVFLTLLLSSEIGVLFSPSDVATEFRQSLKEGRSRDINFWAGMCLGLSIVVTISAVLANFTAWSVFSSLSGVNTPVVLRSTLGLYASQLPSALVRASIYLFILWFNLFWYVIYQNSAALWLSLISVGGTLHVMSTYSATARLIMYTSAMANERIVDKNREENLTPEQLADELIETALLAKLSEIQVNKQYRVQFQEEIRATTIRETQEENKRLRKQLERFQSQRTGN